VIREGCALSNDTDAAVGPLSRPPWRQPPSGWAAAGLKTPSWGSLDERAFFNDKPRPGAAQRPKCRRTSDYSVRWVRRSKKDRLPGGAAEPTAQVRQAARYLLRL
jgi:hypothetical protein